MAPRALEELVGGMLDAHIKIDQLLRLAGKSNKILEALVNTTDDLKAGQSALDAAVAKILADVATTVSNGVSAADGEAIAADLNAQAQALLAGDATLTAGGVAPAAGDEGTGDGTDAPVSGNPGTAVNPGS